MLDTRSTMKGKYTKNQSLCPHCDLGRSVGVLEIPAHLRECQAYLYLRQGIDPKLVDEDRAPYLSKVVLRRKELEDELRSGTKEQEQGAGAAVRSRSCKTDCEIC